MKRRRLDGDGVERGRAVVIAPGVPSSGQHDGPNRAKLGLQRLLETMSGVAPGRSQVEVEIPSHEGGGESKLRKADTAERTASLSSGGK